MKLPLRPLTRQLRDRLDLLLREQINTATTVDHYIKQTTEKLIELIVTEIQYYKGR